MLRAGQKTTEIKGLPDQRYGDSVLARPPVKSTTTLLWFAPRCC